MDNTKTQLTATSAFLNSAELRFCIVYTYNECVSDMGMSPTHEPCHCGLWSQTPAWTCRVRADRVFIDLAHSCLHGSLWAMHIKNIPYMSLVCHPFSLWDLQGEKRPSILTSTLLKMKCGGGLPSPWQRSSTVSPSLTKPWGDSFQSSTMVVGSVHTHKIKLSRLIQRAVKVTL